MKYSKGIMWLDDCRIPFVDEKVGGGKKATSIFGGDAGYEHDGFTTNDTAGRFTPNLLVCDDMLNDGNESKGRTKYPDKNLLPMDYYDGLKKPYPTDIQQTKEGFSDKGSNSRYYDLDLWFDKMLEKL